MPPIWDDRSFTLRGTSLSSSHSLSPRVPSTSHAYSLSNGVPFGIMGYKASTVMAGEATFVCMCGVKFPILNEATWVGRRSTGSSPSSAAL